MELKRPQPIGVAFLVVAYVVMALLLTCGCSLHVGDAPCTAYARAVEERLAACGYTDAWYQEKLRGIYAQCDDGPLGLTFIDGDQADECIDRVRSTSCEQMERGAPTCIGAVKL